MNKHNTLAIAGLGPMLSLSLSNFINMMFRKEDESPGNHHQPRNPTNQGNQGNQGEHRDSNRGHNQGDQSSPTRKQEETESNHNQPTARHGQGQGHEQDRDDQNRGGNHQGMPMERPANDIDEINPGNYENIDTANRENPRNQIEDDRDEA